jgi:hypothetical protein
VHFSLVPHYEIPRDLVEITAVCCENALRKEYNVEYGHRAIVMQVALSIADLTAKTPEEFNEIYEKRARECGISRIYLINIIHMHSGLHHIIILHYLTAVRSGNRDIIR